MEGQEENGFRMLTAPLMREASVHSVVQSVRLPLIERSGLSRDRLGPGRPVSRERPVRLVVVWIDSLLQSNLRWNCFVWRQIPESSEGRGIFIVCGVFSVRHNAVAVVVLVVEKLLERCVDSIHRYGLRSKLQDKIVELIVVHQVFLRV